MGEIDVGHGFFIELFTEKGVVGNSGLLIRGPAGPDCPYKELIDDVEVCGGGIHFENSLIGKKEGRPLWKIESINPLTLKQSIQCKCGFQHGHIKQGRYIPA